MLHVAFVNCFGMMVFSGQVSAAGEVRRKRVIIGVMADHTSIFDLGRAAFNTWYKDVSQFADVFFAIGECSYPPEMSEAVLCLDTPDVYPPQVKEFKLWQRFAAEPAGKYDFFFKVDLDTYVNAERLPLLLDSMKNNIKGAFYSGVDAMGRASERASLGLSRPYCLGFAYMLSHKAAMILSSHADSCIADVKSTHSDTEVSTHSSSCIH